MSEMSAVPAPEVVDAFTSATITALHELALVEAFSVPDPPVKDASTSGPVVAAALRLERPVSGMMSLVLYAELASKLAARYLPAGTELTEELVDDVAGEFANVIAGQAKTILKGTLYHFSLSTPRVTRAANLAELPNIAIASRAITLSSELGQLLLIVELPPCPNS